ncbi:MAG: Ig-like domain-containing protein, partial [Spirochaetota bacterium]|nr:Ig-like domain-containing protein [Spirochaetota bacterium]
MKQNILTFLIIIVLSSFMSYCEEEWADESIDFKVSSVSPGSNSLNVDSGASIIIQFNKSVKTSTFARGFHLSSSDENINLSNYTITWSKSNKKVTLSSPVKLLRTQTTFNITLNSNLKSSAGDGLELYNSVFDTGGARFSYPPTGAYGFNVLSANPNIHYSPSLTFSMKALISGPGIVELFLPLFYTAGTSYGWAPGVRSYYTLTSADMHITVPANGFAANPGPIVISENGVVQKQVYFINPYQFLKKWGSFGTNDYQFGAYYLSIDANNNLYVGDFSNHRILRYNSKGV